MQQKLGKGPAVRKMKLSWVGSECLWPSQIVHLEGLQDFLLMQGARSSDKPVSASQLATLSRHLKSLTLHIKSSLDALNDLQSMQPHHFLCLETLNLRFSTATRLVTFELPKTLTHFTFSPIDKSSLIFPLSALPPTSLIWVSI
jgi:hypothetical protein